VIRNYLPTNTLKRFPPRLYCICRPITTLPLLTCLHFKLEIRSVERSICAIAKSIMTDSVSFQCALWNCFMSTPGLKSDGRNGQDGQPATAKFRDSRSNRRWDMAIFRFFQDGFVVRMFRPHEGHLVVFVTVQNVVRIDSVASLICSFNILRVWLEDAYSHPKIVFLGAKTAGQWVVRCWPQRTRSSFWGCYLCATFSEVDQEIRLWECEQTDTHTHRETEFIICPMLYAIAMSR